MPSTILVADDEKHIVQLVKLYLTNEGFRVETAADGQEALEKARRLRPDLIVLDLMMPRVDGWEVCRRLRKESNVPVIMLTARTDDVDKIVGLELGADDYVTKPFNPRELVARVKAVLRRTQNAPDQDVTVDSGDIHIDPARREVTVGGRPVQLRAKEFDLLLALAQEQGRVLTREALLSRVWGYEYFGDSRTVDVHVTWLRDKLSGSSAQIQTVRGLGYKLVAPAGRGRPGAGAAPNAPPLDRTVPTARRATGDRRQRPPRPGRAVFGSLHTRLLAAFVLVILVTLLSAGVGGRVADPGVPAPPGRRPAERGGGGRVAAGAAAGGAGGPPGGDRRRPGRPADGAPAAARARPPDRRPGPRAGGAPGPAGRSRGRLQRPASRPPRAGRPREPPRPAPLLPLAGAGLDERRRVAPAALHLHRRPARPPAAEARPSRAAGASGPAAGAGRDGPRRRARPDGAERTRAPPPDPGLPRRAGHPGAQPRRRLARAGARPGPGGADRRSRLHRRRPAALPLHHPPLAPHHPRRRGHGPRRPAPGDPRRRAATRWPSWPRPSTACPARWSARSRPCETSWPTPPTSCAPP